MKTSIVFKYSGAANNLFVGILATGLFALLIATFGFISDLPLLGISRTYVIGIPFTAGGVTAIVCALIFRASAVLTPCLVGAVALTALSVMFLALLVFPANNLLSFGTVILLFSCIAGTISIWSNYRKYRFERDLQQR